MKTLLPFLGLILCLLTAPVSLRATEAPKVPTLKDRIYYFQHRLMPKWTHDTQGGFFAAMSKGESTKLKEAAAEIVTPEFAAKLEVRPRPSADQVLIAFAPPAEVPQCYYVLIVKQGEAYRYFTLELTFDISEQGLKSVVGEWTADGSHHNNGPRLYTDADSFIADITKLLKEG